MFMDKQTLVSKRVLPACVGAALLLMTPMFVADADSALAPAHARYLEELLNTHGARYMMSHFGRVPLQCAAEMHGA